MCELFDEEPPKKNPWCWNGLWRVPESANQYVDPMQVMIAVPLMLRLSTEREFWRQKKMWMYGGCKRLLFSCWVSPVSLPKLEHHLGYQHLSLFYFVEPTQTRLKGPSRTFPSVDGVGSADWSLKKRYYSSALFELISASYGLTQVSCNCTVPQAWVCGQGQHLFLCEKRDSWEKSQLPLFFNYVCIWGCNPAGIRRWG
jgi:hypothetical protein